MNIKTSLILATVLSPTFSTSPSLRSEPTNEIANPIQVKESSIIISNQPNINDLIDALIYVESKGKEDCIGDTNLATPSIGVLQIRRVMVREVNRILKKLGSEKRYTYKDRESREKSIEMFLIWQEYHHKDDDFQTIARCWNGGPRGDEKSSTLYYWSKVSKKMKIPPPEVMVSGTIEEPPI